MVEVQYKNSQIIMGGLFKFPKYCVTLHITALPLHLLKRIGSYAMFGLILTSPLYHTCCKVFLRTRYKSANFFYTFIRISISIPLPHRNYFCKYMYFNSNKYYGLIIALVLGSFTLYIRIYNEKFI
jgi:hypothetical protein